MTAPAVLNRLATCETCTRRARVARMRVRPVGCAQFRLRAVCLSCRDDLIHAGAVLLP
jgi:hypothetical protein